MKTITIMAIITLTSLSGCTNVMKSFGFKQPSTYASRHMKETKELASKLYGGRYNLQVDENGRIYRPADLDPTGQTPGSEANGQKITIYGNGQYGYSQSYQPTQLHTILPSEKPHYTHDESHFF